jgi:hypothetical protein
VRLDLRLQELQSRFRRLLVDLDARQAGKVDAGAARRAPASRRKGWR